MSTSVATKYAKQIQSRASAKGYRISLADARDYYVSMVVNQGEKPTEEEFSKILKVVADNRPSVNSLTVSTSQQVTNNQENQEMSSMTPVQSSEVPNNTSGMIHQNTAPQVPQSQLAVTHNDIQLAVEQQFGSENQATKQAILNYVAQDTFSTAQELQAALAKLRTMRLDILYKLISDFNIASKSDESLLKTALSNASVKRQQETADFFDSFENQLAMMRNTFGL